MSYPIYMSFLNLSNWHMATLSGVETLSFLSGLNESETYNGSSPNFKFHKIILIVLISVRKNEEMKTK